MSWRGEPTRMLNRSLAMTCSVVVAGIALADLAGSDEGSAGAIVEHVLYSMAVGPDSLTNISDREPGCCDENGSAGFGAIGPDGAAYFFDAPIGNIKVFESSGVRVLSAPADVSGLPIDMAVTSAAIFILFDAHRERDRYLVARRSHSAGEWQPVPFFYGPGGLDFHTIPQAVVTNLGNAGHLYVGSDATVYFYHSLAHESYPIARGDSVYPPEEQVSRGFEGIQIASGARFLCFGGTVYRTNDGEETKMILAGSVQGVSDDAMIYTLDLPGGETTVIRMFMDGRLVARADRPPRNNWKSLSGKRTLQVAPEGGLYEFQPMEDRLVISVWRSGAR